MDASCQRNSLPVNLPTGRASQKPLPVLAHGLGGRNIVSVHLRVLLRFWDLARAFHETKYVRIVADKSAAHPAEIPADRLSFRLARLEAAKGPHEIGDGRADLNRTVFLHEMDALHCDFRLIGPCAAKLALTAMVERTRLGMEI